MNKLKLLKERLWSEKDSFKMGELSFELYQATGYPPDFTLDDLREDREVNENLFNEGIKNKFVKHQETSRKSVQRFKKHLGIKNE